MKRAVQIVVGLLVLAGLVAGAYAVGAYTPSPADCTALLEQAQHTSDVGTLLEEAGCVEPTPTGHDPTARP